MRHNRLILLLATLGVVAVVGAGCATKTVAPLPADTAPLANSPANAVKRFEWAMNHKSAETIRDMLTDDFVLISASMDSAGNPGRDTLGTGTGSRTWFSDALAAMDSASSVVTCLMDAQPTPFPDARPGKNPRFHAQVRSSFDLRVDVGGDRFGVTGNLLVFVTRGDSASIPAELQARGVRPDSTQWWFEHMEDETFSGANLPSATQPSRNWTFAALLELFHALRAR
jgi:hypothetical protein